MRTNRENEEIKDKSLYKLLFKVRQKKVNKETELEVLEEQIKDLESFEKALSEQLEINKKRPKLAKNKDMWTAKKIKNLTGK